MSLENVSIKREDFLFDEGFGEVTFSDERCTLNMMMMDHRLQSGTLIYNKSPYAPRVRVSVTDEGTFADLDFAIAAVSFDNWEKIKTNTDEMYQFYMDFLKEYSDELNNGRYML